MRSNKRNKVASWQWASEIKSACLGWKLFSLVTVPVYVPRKPELDGQIADIPRVMHYSHGQDPLCLTITAIRIIISNDRGFFGVCDERALSPCLSQATMSYIYQG